MVSYPEKDIIETSEGELWGDLKGAIALEVSPLVEADVEAEDHDEGDQTDGDFDKHFSTAAL